MKETEKIWMNGEFVDWADAKIHVGAHGLHYGSGVFEGIRCYETDAGPAVFRLTPHLKRMHQSAQLLDMVIPYSVEELREVTHELIAVNGLSECYLRPFAFYGYGELGVHTKGNPVEVVIMSWPWGNYLGDENATTGIRAAVSSWKRVGANTIPHVAKATGIYLNSMLAVHEAQRAGYDEAILLTEEGFVADGSGENIFVVKDGTITTPPLSTSILPGITRDTLIQIAQDLGYVANAYAQALARSATQLIGLVVHDIADPYFSSIARGVQMLSLPLRPSAIEELQAASAVGQGRLYRTYYELLRERGIQSAPMLLTFFDMSARTHYLNARQTLRKLLDRTRQGAPDMTTLVFLLRPDVDNHGTAGLHPRLELLPGAAVDTLPHVRLGGPLDLGDDAHARCPQ